MFMHLAATITSSLPERSRSLSERVYFDNTVTLLSSTLRMAGALMNTALYVASPPNSARH